MNSLNKKNNQGFINEIKEYISNITNGIINNNNSNTDLIEQEENTIYYE